MTSSITGIPSSRVSDLFIRQQLLNQMQISQAALYQIQTQLSTGKRFQTPSDDPVAALQIMNLQSLLERKTQIGANLNTNGTYMNVTDSTLSGVSTLLTDIRATAISVVGTSATDTDRQAAAGQVEQTLRQLLSTGNQQFTGRYLFSGSESATEPFKTAGDCVQYVGNEQRLYSYADLNQLFNTNLNGNQVFGAISSAVQGTAKITPNLTYDTRLADLRQGQGISKGSILVSDGTHSSTIDISGAETVGDLAAIIHAHPPLGRDLDVDITSDRIVIQLDKAGGGNLSIHEVGGGTVAAQLGIRRDMGVGNNPIEGSALEPVLSKTTSLQNILGAYAGTVVHSSGFDNDILIKADVMGATTSTGVELNDVHVTLVNDPAISAGHEYVEPVPFNGQTINVHIDSGFTRAYQVINAINAAHDLGNIPFTAEIDPTDNVSGGQNLVDAGASAVTRDGRGEPLDQQSGLLITNGGKEHNISLTSAKTVEDLLNSVNADTGLLAEINQTKDGIDLRSRDSGADFMIGENGGKTATQLGLRTFTENTCLDDLNFGRGVGKVSDPNTTDDKLVTHVSFTIVRADETEIKLDLTNPQTIGDVLDAINNDPSNADGKLVARLSLYGNGIDLVDTSTGKGELTVIPDAQSTSAFDLGLVSNNQPHSDSAIKAYTAKLISIDPVTSDPVANTSVIVQAWDTNLANSGLQVVLDKTVEGVTYDAVHKTLTVGIDPHGKTTANDVINLINNSDYNAMFHASLDPAGGNNGTGKVVDGSSGIMYGAKLTSINYAPKPVANTGVIISPINASDNLNGVQVVYNNGAAGVNYDAVGKILTVGITAGTTTAHDVVTAINTSAYSTMFSAALDPSGGNDGSGKVLDGTSGIMYGTKLTSLDPVTHNLVANAGLLISATDTIEDVNGVQVVLQDGAIGVNYDAVGKILTVGITAGTTTAGDVVTAINTSAYAAMFDAALDPSGGNDGSGKVSDGTTGIIYNGAVDISMVTAPSPMPNAGVVVSAANTSDDLKGVQVVFKNGATGVDYDEDHKILTVGITAWTTSANDVVTAINTSAYASMFHAALDPIGGNNGAGKVVDGTTSTIEASSVLVGKDVNQKETEGVFTALIRLRHGLENNDEAEISRAMDLLDQSTTNMNFVRAELGTNQQNVDVMKDRLSSENIEIRTVLSNNYDTDIAQAVSDFASRQAAFEASLRATASIMQMSLLNYL